MTPTLPPVAISQDTPEATTEATTEVTGQVTGQVAGQTAPQVDVATRAHHKLGPSKLGYIDQCAAFTSRDSSASDNTASEDGTFLHELMRLMLLEVVAGNYRTTGEQVFKWVVERNELTPEEIESLLYCCRRCDFYLAKSPSKIDIEISVEVRKLDGSELNHGSLDVLFHYKNNTGILLDYKFGWVPVPAAKKNLQLKNYAAGCFQKYPLLAKIGGEMIQPKLFVTSGTVFSRENLPDILNELADVITRAEHVRANPAEAQKYMKVGPYCNYCAVSGSCTKLANTRALAVTRMNDLPTPPSFKGLELSNPADIALARYWVDMMEAGVEEIKARAFAAAEANGGRIEHTLPNGEVIAYEIKERNCDRVLGNAVEIATAFKEVVTPEEILAAAKLSVGELEKIVSKAMVEVAKHSGEKLTLKTAKEQMMDTLEALNLVTQSDKKIRYLKFVKPAAPSRPQISAEAESKK